MSVYKENREHGLDARKVPEKTGSLKNQGVMYLVVLHSPVRETLQAEKSLASMDGNIKYAYVLPKMGSSILISGS